MNDREKSDGSVVPANHRNKAGKLAAADDGEGRGPAKGNLDQQNAPRTQCRTHGAHSALDRVRLAARRGRDERFTSLFHHLSLDRLRSAYWRLKRKAAPGVDGETWQEYGRDLEARLQGLHARLHRGAYRAKPTRRTWIPKADGRQRPLGIASLEDKILQAATVEVLQAIYEQDFLGFSYGFRPGRGAHDALDALATGILRKKVNWVLDADIRGFFDAIDQRWMVKFLEHRIADPRMLRLLQKWLRAGVLEDGVRKRAVRGTPQGAPVSPLLANVYLHYAFDQWAHQWRRRHARGDVLLVRYADDFVVGFQHRSDAVRFRAALAERLRQFSLELHPEKTRLVEFGRYARLRREEAGRGKPETFTFLGLRHICARTTQGKFLLTRRTDAKRMRARLASIKDTLMRRRHAPVAVQGRWLRSVVQGYLNYHAVPTNIRAISRFRTEVVRLWMRALRRRSQRARGFSWKRLARLEGIWLPSASILHPWPEARFDRRTQGRSPVR